MDPMSVNCSYHDGSPFEEGHWARARGASYLSGNCLLRANLRVEKEVQKASQPRTRD